jgi:hypothetical protein
MISSYLQFRELMLKYSGIDQGHLYYFDLKLGFREALLKLRLTNRE